MKGASILIVEDEVLIADGIRMDLLDLGYAVPQAACATYEQAVTALAQMRPDLILLDIKLKGPLSGIDLAAYINANVKIPFLFLTSHLSGAIFEAVREVEPAGFLTKPYSPQNLWANIELALCRRELLKDQPSMVMAGHKGKQIHYFSNLIFLEAEGSYTRYYFDDQEKVQRKTLKEAMAEVPEGLLLQIHRSFAVNPRKVSAFTNRKIFLHGREIPISRSKQDEILAFLAVKQN